MQLSTETEKLLILKLLGLGTDELATNGPSFYKMGSDYVIRSVTMIYLGKLKKETSEALILEDCAWIPDTSRWNEFLGGKKPNEMEPYSHDVIVYKSGILDSTELTKKIVREVI